MKTSGLVTIALVFALFLPRFAYGDGENFLFYNSVTREGAVGKLTGNDFRTTKTFPTGAFGRWTQIACVDGLHTLLFYNAQTGAGTIGILDGGDFKTTNTLNGFSGGWTHILDAGLHHDAVSLPLFYNSAAGSGAVGYAPPVRLYPDGAFARGWTHIVAESVGILFYNAHTGAGAVAVPFDSSPHGLQNIDNIRTVTVYKPGEFTTNWTQVVCAAPDILFYNSADGSAVIGRLVPQIVAGATTFQTTTTYPAGSFARGWTHIVSTRTQVLCYNALTGEGAIGEVANNRFHTTKTFPPGAFAKGWTHIVAASSDSPPPSPPH